MLTSQQNIALGAIRILLPDIFGDEDCGMDAACMAFCEVESSFRPDSYRYEPRLRDASYGLMQILLKTARDRGFVGSGILLNIPATGLRYGMLQVKWTWDYLREQGMPGATIKDVAGAYNAGVGNVIHGFVPENYVSTWDAAFVKWQGLLSKV